MAAQRWVFLADPKSYGWAELVREKRAVWDGIAGSAAQRNLRKVEEGDAVLLYHTAPDKALVGTATVARGPYPDPTAPDRAVVDLVPEAALPRPLPLAELKADPELAQMSFVRMPRVAVQPVTDEQWKRVLAAARVS